MNRHALRPIPNKESGQPDLARQNCILSRFTYTILGEVHIGGENVCPSTVLHFPLETAIETGTKETYEFLSKEVLLQRTLSGRIILQCNITVCTEGTRKHGDITEYRFTIKMLGNDRVDVQGNRSYRGLSKMFDILYSKFWAATGRNP